MSDMTEEEFEKALEDERKSNGGADVVVEDTSEESDDVLDSIIEDIEEDEVESFPDDEIELNEEELAPAFASAATDEDTEPEDMDIKKTPKSGPADMDGYINVMTGSSEEIANRVFADTDGLTQEEILALIEEKVMNDPSSPLAKTLFHQYKPNSPTVTAAAKADVYNWDKYVKDECWEGDTDPKFPNGNSMHSKVAPIPNKTKGKRLSGKAAILTFMSGRGGVKKIYLPNSGINITIQAMTSADLYAMIQTIEHDTKEIGRMLGAHFWSLGATYLTAKFIELLPNFVVGSNYENWKNSKKLANVISYNDYPIILLALCSLQYPKGVDIPIYCAADGCEYESRVKVDLDELRITNNSVLSPAAITTLMESRTMSDAELKTYREEYLNIDFTDKVENFEYRYKVPSVGEFVNNAKNIIGEMSRLVKGKLDTDKSEVAGLLNTTLYKSLQIWVQEISMYDGDELIGITDDKTVILNMLQTHASDAHPCYDNLHRFMTQSKASFIMTTLLKCPKCGAVPADAIDDYVAFDPMKLFFVTAFRYLHTAGLI